MNDRLIPKKTVCDFEVVRALDERSKAGSDMVHLTLKVFYNEGWRLVDDYLLDAMPAKLRHFCERPALSAKYAAGAVTANDCLAITGKVRIGVEDKQDGYLPKNKVQDYLPEEKGVIAREPRQPIGARRTSPETMAAAGIKPAEQSQEDDVPF